jgi:hypothetical protein
MGSAATAWDLADHALGPVLTHPAYPYLFAGVLALTTMLGWNLLRLHLRPNYAAIATAVGPIIALELSKMGSKAPTAGVVEDAVHRGMDQVRNDIADLRDRVLVLETRMGSPWQRGDRDRRRT